MKIVLVLTCILMSKASIAQKTVDSLLNRPISNIDIKSLAGFWETTDSLKTKIEFIDSSWYQLTLDLKNNSHPYFFSKGKTNTVSSSGFYPNWPPFSCDLNLIDSKTLEMTFSIVGTITHTIRCKKE